MPMKSAMFEGVLCCCPVENVRRNSTTEFWSMPSATHHGSRQRFRSGVLDTPGSGDGGRSLSPMHLTATLCKGRVGEAVLTMLWCITSPASDCRTFVWRPSRRKSEAKGGGILVQSWNCSLACSNKTRVHPSHYSVGLYVRIGRSLPEYLEVRERPILGWAYWWVG